MPVDFQNAEHRQNCVGVADGGHGSVGFCDGDRLGGVSVSIIGEGRGAAQNASWSEGLSGGFGLCGGATLGLLEKVMVVARAATPRLDEFSVQDLANTVRACAKAE